MTALRLCVVWFLNMLVWTARMISITQHRRCIICFFTAQFCGKDWFCVRICTRSFL